MSSAIIEWKVEPASPLLDAERDAWLFFEDDVTAPKDDIAELDYVSSSSLPTKAEVAQQLLDDIEDYVKKENYENFSNWFEEKVDLPIFEEIPSVLPTDGFTKPGLEKNFDGFGYVFGEGQLTPPQSPPTKPLTPPYEETSTFVLPNENVRVSFQPVYLQPGTIVPSDVRPTYVTLLPPVVKPTADTGFLTAPPTPVPDIEKELAVVDEVVRDTVNNLDPNWDRFDSEAFHSDASSESFACSSPRSTSAEEETDDPEWSPDETLPSSRKRSSSTRRYKPYSRSIDPEDKRLRKREQNKNAATRYRQKKKAEVSEIIEEEKQLEEKNAELEQRVADIKTEIKYLKGLMRDLFKAKGLIK